MTPETNRNGSILTTFPGPVGEINRIAAHTWLVPSSTKAGEFYKVFIRSLCPRIYRCQCDGFLFSGSCNHGKTVLVLESRIRHMYPNQYRKEKDRQRRTIAHFRRSKRLRDKLKKDYRKGKEGN